MTTEFRQLPADRAADDLEREVLDRWKTDGLFDRTLKEREGGPEFVFLEGPPTANGRPGIHHVFARTLKDLFCRYRVMKGFHVTRKAGWDTHGLPVEIEVEKQLGISGKQQIEEIGVERFNQLCRESVFKYREDWQALSERIGYWLDYDDAYITFSNDYVESVWWALKTLYDRDLLFKGHKILPYCPRCGTALSSHEVAQGYEDVQDPSVYVAFELAEPGDGDPLVRSPQSAVRSILIWTTTPWTLVANVGVAVHPDLQYVEVRRRGGKDARTLIVAEARLGGVFGDDWTDRWDTVGRLRGSDLAGKSYRRPLDWVAYPPEGKNQVIVAEDFVSADDGTGLVHMAPAFGADDYAAVRRHGLAFFQPVNQQGEFPADIPVVGGKFIKDADPLIIDELKRRGSMFKAGTLTHAYPHCWRCGTPLLYYARTSWFIRTTAFRDEMLARNARVSWHPPEMGEGRFGEWLKNNVDWAISRDRYWGTPLPVWQCDRDDAHRTVIGGYAELAKHTGTPLPADFDPHKPFIDKYTWPCASCAGTMRRTPEVIDTWFDSGSMPFAQWHYPFKGKDQTARHYPGDFIAEGVDQTRGWFYSLLAIATGLGDALPNNVMPGTRGTATAAAPYRSVVVNDLVLDAQGVKMSKSRGNTVEPWDVLQRHGADAVRLFLIASSQVWVPRRFDEEAIRETAGRFLVTLKNVYSGIFALYANFGWSPSKNDPPVADRPILDRWILSRLAIVERIVDQHLDGYDATLAARAVTDFLVDDVSNWYVRLSRARFYDIDGTDNRAAFATLHEVLVVTTRMLAPFAPFVSDWIHQELTGTSVHLATFGGATGPIDQPLDTAMRQVRELARLARAAREDAGLRVRQPLARMVCVVPGLASEAIEPLLPLLASELNVKRVELANSADALVSLRAKANFRALGRKFGKATPLAAEAVAALGSEDLRRFELGEPISIAVDGQSRHLDPEDLIIIRTAAGDLVVKEEGGFFAAIDPAITPDLRREGLAREVVSRVQRLRRDAGLAVSDRIALAVSGDGEVEEAVRTHEAWIAGEVLAHAVSVGERPEHVTAAQEAEIDGLRLTIALTRNE